MFYFIILSFLIIQITEHNILLLAIKYVPMFVCSLFPQPHARDFLKNVIPNTARGVLLLLVYLLPPYLPSHYNLTQLSRIFNRLFPKVSNFLCSNFTYLGCDPVSSKNIIHVSVSSFLCI
uniref:Uncharacterized protein n=1 Tax=Cacopsylla melanoneura TaxID=428564 RepID=A0A8D8ZHY7_9HEMI